MALRQSKHAKKQKMTTWFITGGSTGLGKALAGAVLASGDNAAITARDCNSLEPLQRKYPDSALAISLEVTSPEQIEAAIRSTIEQFDAVDVLVNNAGYGYRAAVEEGATKDIEKLFATNFDGPVNLIKAVLPAMRHRKSGTIVNISYISAKLQSAGSGYYSASKSAMEGVSVALFKELAPLGISVITVEPGGFRTDFTGRSLAQVAEPRQDYAETAGKRRKENGTTDGRQPGDPVKAAAALLTAVNANKKASIFAFG